MLRSVGVAVAVLLVSGVSVGAIALKQVSDDLGQGVALQGEETAKAAKQAPGLTAYEGGFNVLIVGTDNDVKQGDSFGKRDATLNDVNILLHVSADHSNATAVSIPRDLVVPIPSCPKEDGSGTTPAMSAQPINSAYEDGGLNCVVQTVKQLTGVDVPFAGLISFNGVIEMTNAIGGVPVCVNEPVTDRYTGLDLPAGSSTLQGADALAFLRSRHGIGDGSDLGRISSQQVYLSSMLRTIKSGGVLASPTKLYKLARAAASNMTLSNSLNDLDTMTKIGLALKDLPLQNVNFVQYPGSTGGTGVYSGKVQPDTATAGRLFDAIRADRPFGLTPGSTGVGSETTQSGAAAPAPSSAAPAPVATGSASGSASTTPAPGASAGTTAIEGLTGQTAADRTCSVAYRF
ncbi:Putative transcriptional regulator YwtF [Frondihabitans sp. 762G35]|uniref:LCP family protein n=1 Tax=Frondihabitans sp. 762G35 TaxID=1446794 RepID=UPI000D224E1C|nr:LCP family protein [Frondihabitans sp. 762G35]ARC58049.1 Putative transcriptional regulator YwtF [Frondihabitans sp. 762G35]